MKTASAFLAGILLTAFAALILGAAGPPQPTSRYSVEISNSEMTPGFLRLAAIDHDEQQLHWYYVTLKGGRPKATKLLASFDLTSVGSPELALTLHDGPDADIAQE